LGVYLTKQVALWGIGILFIDKKDGELKMCIDYYALNKMKVKYNYPLPCIDDILDWFNGAKYFSQIDPKSR